MAEDTRKVETEKDFGDTPESNVSRWLAEIKSYEKQFERWEKRCKKISARYRAEQETEDADDYKRVFNILWANVQTLGPALFARSPVPDVSRRYKDRDPIGRAASVILERCLSYSVDNYDFIGTIKASRDDYILTARGQGWVRYVPHFGEETQDRIFLQTVEGDNGPQHQDDEGKIYAEVEMDGDRAFVLGEKYRPVLYEEAICDHIAWGSFGHSPAPTWEKVSTVWKKELLTRDQLVERFGEDKGKKVALKEKANAGITDEAAKSFGDVFMRAAVYEIWHRPSKKAIWISPGYTEEPLDVQDDPLRLSGFFPCPKPVFGTMTTDTLVPVPDYIEYQSQALELDILTQRIHLLLKALRVVGVYDSSITALENLLEGEDNRMVGVDQWAMFAEKGGLQGTVSFFPVKEIADVLVGLSNARNQVKQDLYEISGISDIVRGQVDPREKLGQSQLKGQFATLRLQDRQSEMNRFVRDILRLKGEIISEHFSEETMLMMSGWLETVEAKALDRANAEALAKVQAMQVQMQQAQMAGQPMPPMEAPQVPPTAREVFAEAVALLREDRLRTFRVEIETDSTVFEDQQAEKQGRAEFLTAAGGFLQQAIEAGKAEPALRPLLAEMLLFGVRGFKAGRSLEAMFEQAIEDMQTAPPPQPQPEQTGPDPAVEQAKIQVQGQEVQRKAAKDQADAAFNQAKLETETQATKAEIAADREQRLMDHDTKMRELAQAQEALNQKWEEMNLKAQEQSGLAKTMEALMERISAMEQDQRQSKAEAG